MSSKSIGGFIMPALAMGLTYATAGGFAAMNMMQGLTFAGGAVNLAGQLSGNKKLTQLGNLAMTVGSVGQLANAAGITDIGTKTTMGELFGGAAPATPSAAAAPLSQTAAPAAMESQTPLAFKPTAGGGAVPSAMETALAGTPVSSVQAPGFGPSAGMSGQAIASAASAPVGAQIPTAGGMGAAGGAAPSGAWESFKSFAKENPMLTYGGMMAGGQAVAGAVEAYTQADLVAAQEDLTRAQAAFAQSQTEANQQALRLAEERIARINQNMQQQLNFTVNPNAVQFANQTQLSGGIIGSQMARS